MCAYFAQDTYYIMLPTTSWLKVPQCSIPGNWPGTRFTKEFSLAIQPKRKNSFCCYSFLRYQIATNICTCHDSTAQLSWHVKKFVAITWWHFEWKQHKIFVDFSDSPWKILSEMGSRWWTERGQEMFHKTETGPIFIKSQDQMLMQLHIYLFCAIYCCKEQPS